MVSPPLSLPEPVAKAAVQRTTHIDQPVRQAVKEKPAQMPPPPDQLQPPQSAEGGVPLERKISTRAESGVGLPLIRVRPAIQRSEATGQVAILPQARHRPELSQPAQRNEREQLSTASTTGESVLPLVPPLVVEVVQPRPEMAGAEFGPPATGAVVQRWPAGAGPELATRTVELARPAVASSVLQRLEEEESTPAGSETEAQESTPDLDKLARQIYPLLKRMLAVERDRRPFR